MSVLVGLQNQEYYLSLSSKNPSSICEVQDKLDDLYWEIAKREDTEASYKKYLELDTKLNRNHYNDALSAYQNYEYIILVKMSIDLLKCKFNLVQKSFSLWR